MLGVEDGVGRWDLELGVSELQAVGELPGWGRMPQREGKVLDTESPGTNPARLLSVIRKGIMAQGHCVSKVFPNVL